MARRSFRAPALCLSLLPTFAVACGDDPIDNNNQFTTTNGGDMGTDGTADEVGETASDSGSSDGSTDGTSSDDDPGDSTDNSTDNSTDTSTTTDSTDTAGECTTPPDQVGSSCGQSSGIKGPVHAGETINLGFGGIEGLDNGLGNGEEDWYQIEFPIAAMAPRPGAGTPTIGFALNDDDDYRFEIYRDCGADAYGQGLAADFGAGAPPLTEWSFNDLDPGALEQLDYMEMVTWPTAVWVRVFRFQNDGACNNYQLLVSRP